MTTTKNGEVEKEKQAHSIKSSHSFLGTPPCSQSGARIFPSVIEEAVVVVLVLEGKDSLSNELVE